MRLIAALVLSILLLNLRALAQASPNDAAIRAVIARETEGWDKFDPGQVASDFTPDTVWQPDAATPLLLSRSSRQERWCEEDLRRADYGHHPFELAGPLAPEIK